VKTIFSFVTTISICFILLTGVGLYSADSAETGETIEGNWMGKIDNIRVVFRIMRNADGSYEAYTDSPDQMAFDIPVEGITLEDGNVHLEVRPLGLIYEGKLISNSIIEGALKQGDYSMPLVVERVDEVPKPPRRPQTPKKPYPYNEEDIAYENKAAGVKIAGTLTLPRSRGAFPAVLLIAGSGPQNRDEELLCHRPFLVLADYLTRHGIAVLRIDKRGVGESTGNFGQATYEDFASDALAGVEYLKARKEIEPDHIGLIGHSEGAAVAAIVASQSPDVAFIIMMAGVGINGYENMILQDLAVARSKGATEEEIALIRSWCGRFYAIPVEEEDHAIAREKMQQLYDTRTEAEEHAFRFLHGITLQIDYALSPGMRSSLTFDPQSILRKVKCPVLAINGEKDVQVPARENLRGIEETLMAAGNNDCKVKELPGLNHLFQTADTGAMSEYAEIEETMSPVVLETIANCVLTHANTVEVASP